tara:strand:+ start:1542 stop:2639 length:1098 start_codon:yes stop_codon:yes gene_type:complete
VLNIKYIFNDSKLIRSDSSGYAKDFLYGYSELSKNNKFNISAIELNKKNKFNYLSLKSFLFARIFKIGFAENKLIYFLDDLKNASIIIATNDAIALGAAFIKKKYKLKYKIIYLNMGLGDRLFKAKNNNFFLYIFFKFIITSRLKLIDQVVCLGIIEKNFLDKEFKDYNKFHYQSFGVDVGFWDYIKYSNNHKKYITFIGNDSNRDIHLLRKLIIENPNEKFCVVTTRKLNLNSDNLIRIKGHLNKAHDKYNDSYIKNIYHSSKFVIIPLIDCIQPSGQSVMLQSMSCGTPVLISNSFGLFSNKLINEENCIISFNANDFLKKFKKINNSSYDLNLITRKARLEVENYFNHTIFSNFLTSIINKI